MMKNIKSNANNLIRFMLTIFLLGQIHILNADDFHEQKKALDMIAEFADKICSKVPLEGTSHATKLDINVKAELNGVAKKIANLGFDTAGKFDSSKYNGLLRNDLLPAMKSNTDCKLQVFKDLKDKLIKPINKK